MLRVRLRLFGTPVIEVGDRVVSPVRFENRKAVALLAYLAVTRQAQSRERLAALLWPDIEGALAALRTTLWEARKKLGDDAFAITRQDIALVQNDAVQDSAVWVDVSEYAALLQSPSLPSADRVPSDPGDDLMRKIERWQYAVDLYQDDFLAGFSLRDSQEFDDWQMAQTAYFQRLQSRALLDLVGMYQAAGDAYAAIQTAERLRAMDRLAQEPVEALMRLYAASGQRQAVFRLYEEYAALLDQELGATPDESLTALYEAALHPVAERPAEARSARPVAGALAAGGTTAAVYRAAETVIGRPRRLFGRDDLVLRVLDLLRDGERVLLTGMGGIGKTSLAATLSAEYVRASGQPVIWLETGFQNAREILLALARAFNQQSILSKPDPAAAVMELLASQNGLLVLDNCWNASALFEVMNAVPNHLPALLTSRQRIPIDGEVIDVGILDADDARQLLAYHARREFREDADLPDLLNMLGHHPYAIEIAGKQLKAQPGLSVRELRARYLRGTHEIAVPGGYGSAERQSIERVIAASVDTISDDARSILTHMGALASPRASLELIALILDAQPDRLEPAFAELEQSSLLDMGESGAYGRPVCRMHDLIYSYCRERFRESGLDRRALVRGMRAYLGSHSREVMAVELEYTNILGAVRAAGHLGDSRAVIALLRAVMVDGYFDARGYTPELLEHLDEAIRLADTLPDEQESLHYLSSKRANAYQMQGRLDDAFQENLIALATAPNTYRRALLATTLGTIAHRLKREGEYQIYLNEAEAVARKHDIQEVLSRIMEYRGNIAMSQGKPVEARAFLVDAVGFAEHLNMPDRAFFALYNLAFVEIELGDYDAAEQRLERAYQLAVEQENDLWKGMCYSSMGRCTHARGDRDTTYRLMTQALQIYERTGSLPFVNWVRSFFSNEAYVSS